MTHHLRFVTTTYCTTHRLGSMFDEFHFNSSGKYVPGLGMPNNTKPTIASECCSCKWPTALCPVRIPSCCAAPRQKMTTQ